MNDSGNQYALAALKDKRAALSSEIITLKGQIRARQVALEHVDATLRILDPNADPDRIRPKRIPKHVNIFRSGELSRLIIDTLRRGGRPMATQEIVTVNRPGSRPGNWKPPGVRIPSHPPTSKAHLKRWAIFFSSTHHAAIPAVSQPNSINSEVLALVVQRERKHLT